MGFLVASRRENEADLGERRSHDVRVQGAGIAIMSHFTRSTEQASLSRMPEDGGGCGRTVRFKMEHQGVLRSLPTLGACTNDREAVGVHPRLWSQETKSRRDDTQPLNISQYASSKCRFHLLIASARKVISQASPGAWTVRMRTWTVYSANSSTV
ncbi:hypothetical protein VTK56DRAFT_1516 [Thermocarpiscus australiensis]